MFTVVDFANSDFDYFFTPRKADVTVKIISQFLNKVLCFFLAHSLKLLFRTCRVKYHFEDSLTPYDDAAPRYTLCIWHDSLIVPIFMHNPPKFVALVGPHRDGSYVTNVLKVLGFDSVRGSSSKQGAKAVVEIIEKSRGIHLGITPDGPRGPRREMKSGCAFIASQTGKPVLATAYSCTNAWRVKGSWTDQMIPKPFSTIYAYASKPIVVPPDASRDVVEQFTQIIQREMDRVNEIAEGFVTGQPTVITSEDSKLRRAA